MGGPVGRDRPGSRGEAGQGKGGGMGRGKNEHLRQCLVRLGYS